MLSMCRSQKSKLQQLLFLEKSDVSDLWWLRSYGQGTLPHLLWFEEDTVRYLWWLGASNLSSVPGVRYQQLSKGH